MKVSGQREQLNRLKQLQNIKKTKGGIITTTVSSVKVNKDKRKKKKEKEAKRSQMQGLPERPASSGGDVIADESFREAHAGGGEQTQYLERTSAEGQASQQAATGLSCD